MDQCVGAAARLPESERKDLAVRALAGLALAGLALATRQILFDFIVEELARREPADFSASARCASHCMQNQRDNLLAFVGVLAAKLTAITQAHAIAEPLVREACLLHRLPSTSAAYSQG